MKNEELKMAKMAIDRLYKKYESLFRADGSVIHLYSRDAEKREITVASVKDEIRYIRRLLLEVSREL